MRSPAVSCVAAIGLLLACSSEPTTEGPTSPAIDSSASLAPGLASLADGGVLLTTLEGTLEGHRLVAKVAHDPPVVVAEGTNSFANWADVPAVVEAGDGSLVAHWLEVSGPETYDYGVRLARSVDGGSSWSEIGWLNDDAWDTEGGAVGEHGFVSWVPEGAGARAFWLDGRGMTDHGEADLDEADHGATGGAMQLRTAIVVDGEVSHSEVLDESVCDCCPTAAVATPNGPLVAFRDRTEDEIRDVHLLRQTDDGWQRTVIDTSGWEIPGCPVNGPALAIDGDQVLVAWYTAHPEPRVYAAWSEDGGVSFGEPQILTTDTLGRVSAAILSGQGYVTWLRRVEEATEGGPEEEIPAGEVRMVRLAPGGNPEDEVVVGETSATRRAGIPRIVADSEGIVLAWTVVAAGGDGEVSTQVAVRRFTPE